MLAWGFGVFVKGSSEFCGIVSVRHEREFALGGCPCSVANCRDSTRRLRSRRQTILGCGKFIMLIGNHVCPATNMG